MNDKKNLDLISALLLQQENKKILMFESIQDGRVYDLDDMLKEYSDEECQNLIGNWKLLNGRSLIHVACYWGQVKCANLILRYHIKHKVNVYPLDDFSYTPFDLACIKGTSHVGDKEGLYDRC